MRTKATLDKSDLVIQKGSYTCGPVSLLNVLRLKGNQSYNEEELAKLCNAKPGIGTSNSNLVKAAKQIDLEIIEEKQDADIADIERNLDKGAYVIVNYVEAFSGDGHYTVVTDYDDKAFYFADCYLGFLHLDKPDFKKWWFNSNKTIHGWYVALK